MDYTSIPHMFYSQSKVRGSKSFILFEEKKYSYSDAAKIVSSTARVFEAHGVKKGSKAIIMLNNSPEFIFASLALMACGAIIIPINVFFKDSEASYIINDSESNFIVTESAFAQIMEGVLVKSPNVKTIFTFDGEIDNSVNVTQEAKQMGTEVLLVDMEITDLAVFIYTSGTTGHPKGAMLTHSNILENVAAFMKAIQLTPKDRFLVMLPMFHTYTFSTCIMFPIAVGASMIILRSVLEMKKKSFRNILLFKRPTFMLGVPQVYSALAKSPMPKWFIKFLYPIKIHVSGGASLPMEIFEQFRSKFGRPVIEGYGLSEASPVVSFNPMDRPKHGTVGKPLDKINVKIVGVDDTELPPNTVGELIVKGPNVMQGYWKMPKATDDAMKNGWLFTGDFAKIDDEGYITIVDRKKDIILSKGMNVYPREIEEVIYTFAGVDAAAVIGVQGNEQGETIIAYIQPKAGETVNKDELRNYLKRELANFKIPKIINIIDNIPLTATGKVLKRKLKEMVRDGLIK